MHITKKEYITVIAVDTYAFSQATDFSSNHIFTNQVVKHPTDAYTLLTRLNFTVNSPQGFLGG